MTIGELIRQGFYYARTCRSLWLFGFFVGIASGGSNGGGSRPGGAGPGGVGPVMGGFWEITPTRIALILGVILVTIVVVTVMRFVGEGALIEGVVRARHGGTMTMREGFRAGLAHFWVLVRIALIYVAVVVVSMVLLVAPCVIALRALGPFGAILVGIPTLFVAVPWLVTLYLVQAFAWRIAVLEHRHALDAIRKARLFLHGRLLHALKVLVASFAGSLLIVLVSIVVMTPIALVLVALIPVLDAIPVIVIACLVLLPVIYVLAAITGTFRSSIWTIGYVTQVES